MSAPQSNGIKWTGNWNDNNGDALVCSRAQRIVCSGVALARTNDAPPEPTDSSEHQATPNMTTMNCSAPFRMNWNILPGAKMNTTANRPPIANRQTSGKS